MLYGGVDLLHPTLPPFLAARPSARYDLQRGSCDGGEKENGKGKNERGKVSGTAADRAATHRMAKKHHSKNSSKMFLLVEKLKFSY